MYIHRGRVAFFETDAAQIVHFANFFRYAEAAETHALHQVGLLQAATQSGMILPRVHVEADYLSPLKFWQEYAVHARLVHLGESSMSWQFDIWSGDRHCAVLRWVSTRRDARGTKAPYLPEEREILAVLMDEKEM